MPTLAEKLGMAAGHRILVLGPAPGAVLAQLPSLHRRPTVKPYDVVVAFCPDRLALEGRAGSLPDRLATKGALWLLWPKRSSGVVTDIGEADVRSAGLATGLVDVKIAAIDDTWSD
ncbi:MAG TPA: hypothetical protein VME70_01005 [Mycobacteriales bacterium]|nr:hypothetical protein [Mycobacteriales bacterium]